MSYLIKAFLLGAFMLCTCWLLGTYADERLYHPHFPFVTLFFLIGSWAAHQGILASLKENAKRFPAYFMGITGIKMMVYLLAISVYVFVMREGAVPVVVLFLALYVLYTALELWSLIPKVRAGNPSGGGSEG